MRGVSFTDDGEGNFLFNFSFEWNLIKCIKRSFSRARPFANLLNRFQAKGPNFNATLVRENLKEWKEIGNARQTPIFWCLLSKLLNCTRLSGAHLNSPKFWRIFLLFFYFFCQTKTQILLCNKYSYQLISAVNHADFALLSIRFKHMKIHFLNSEIILLFVLSMVLGIGISWKHLYDSFYPK